MATKKLSEGKAKSILGVSGSNVHNGQIRADEIDAPQSKPDQITAILGLSGKAAIEAMGLTPVPQDEELP